MNAAGEKDANNPYARKSLGQDRMHGTVMRACSQLIVKHCRAYGGRLDERFVNPVNAQKLATT
jgi:hypothetical protein